MRRLREGTRFERAVRVLHALACLVAAYAVLRNPDSWPTWGVLVVLVLQIATTLIHDKSAHRSVEHGRWLEHQDVLSSIAEAQARDLTGREWLIGYLERWQAEYLSRGMGRRGPPDRQRGTAADG